MTDRAKKVSELTALSNATGEDLLLIIDDPGGTPESKKITVANFFGNVATNTVIRNTLTVNGSITLAGNTLISRPLNVTNTVTISSNLSLNSTLSVNGAVVVNSSGFWVGNTTGLKGDKGDPGSNGAYIFTTTTRNGGASETPTALDLSTSVQKLSNGYFSLANGSEGQLMYLVPQTTATRDGVRVVIASARIINGGNSGIFANAVHLPFSDPLGGLVKNVATLIYTDGAWQSSGGSWQ